MFDNKIILITGGTGSFGVTVLKRLLASSAKEIRIFSRDEKKQEDMRYTFNNPKIKFYIGDIRNYNSIFEAMQGVNYVFHAAALKQVPSCEFYPMEAIQTNILGGENVVNAAIARGVERVVMLSTDKAVYPINAMGLSKAMMEKVMLAKAYRNTAAETILCATRYGNVMGSRGSVIPLFIKQIQEGLPLTITAPSMTRFLMSLEDSVNLVFYAFQHACQGDIFVHKSPAATIGALAQALKELFEANNEICFIGFRHSEKLYESLVSSEEMMKVDDIGQYYRIPLDRRDTNYANFSTIEKKINIPVEAYTSHNTVRLDVDGVKELLLKLDFIQQHMNRITPISNLKRVAA